MQQLELVIASNTVITPIADTVLTEPNSIQFPVLTANAVTWNFEVTPANIPAEGAFIQVQSWLGVGSGGTRAVNEFYRVSQSDNGNPSCSLVIPNPPQTQIGDQVFVTYSGVDLMGGLQAGSADPIFDGQTLICNIITGSCF